MKNKYAQLDALRAIAAFLVLGYHFLVISNWSTGWITKYFKTFHLGWIGVDLFLLISGFVITRSALSNNHLQAAKDRKKFWIRRLTRIFPLYFITCVFWVIFIDPTPITISLKAATIQIVSHLLFLHNLMPATNGAINGVTWSIALEMQFYALIFFVVYKFKLKNIPLTLFSCIFVTWVYRYCLFKFIAPHISVLDLITYAMGLFGFLDQFGFGIALAILATYKKDSKILQQSWKNCLFYLIIFAVSFSFLLDLFWPRSYFWHSVEMIIFWRTALGASFLSLLLAFICFPKIKIDILKPFNYLGKISYGIYLWHMAILQLLVKYTPLRENLLLLAFIATTVLVSSLSWHFLEEPILKWSERYN